VGAKCPRPVVLDAGALIAVERSNRRIVALLELADEIHVPAAVVAQVWRNPARQVRLVRLLATEAIRITALDEIEARAVGHLCAASATANIVDASVALLARRVAGVVVTSDPDDLSAIDPGLELFTC